MKRRTTSWASAAVVLAAVSALHAQDTQPVSEAALAAAAAEVAAEEPRTLLMSWLDQAGVGSKLDEYGISINGWIAGSVTYSLLDNSGGDHTLTGRAFDFETCDPTLNQIGFQVVKGVDFKKANDFGFTFENIWGGDGRFTHSNGMDFQTGTSPDEQYDITQAYVEYVLPFGEGWVVKAGKWITPIGYEYTNPTLNQFYSHSFLFGIIPFSHTGVMVTYHFDDDTSFGLAIARGWEQSLEDNNDAIEVVWSFASTCGDQFTYAFNGSVGPQQDDNNGNYRTMLDFWGDYAVSEKFTIGINADYRYDSANASDGDASCVWGVATYGKYVCNDYVTGGARLEYFNDTSRLDGLDSVIYSATLGVTLTPFPNDAFGSNLKLRPEIRYDYASEDIFDGGDADHQMTLGLEALFTF